MESDEKKLNKKKKWIFLAVSAVVTIVAVVILVIVIINSQKPAPDSGSIVDETDEIMSNYQQSIDKAETNEEKALLHVQRAYDLRQVMYESGRNECEQIEKDVESAKELSLDEELLKTAKSIMSACPSSPKEETQTITAEKVTGNE